MARPAAFFAALLLLPVAAELGGDLDASAFTAGDECAAGDSSCALNALQLKARPAALANHSVPPNTCQEDTFGTCTIKSCSSSRGPAECWSSKGFKCLCPAGWCAVNGACFPSGNQCASDTGGTCTMLSCGSKRGATDCVSGKCVCQAGHCAYKGTCYPVSDTGGSCRIVGCSRTRGPVKCVAGRCICASGLVSINGMCQHGP